MIWVAGLVVACLGAAVATVVVAERRSPAIRSDASSRVTAALDHEEYVELVLQLRRAGPARPGHDVRRDRGGRRAGRGGGGPRLVGSVMAAHGGPVPWWRVVRADGSLPPSHQDEARQAYLEEGTPLRPSGNVDIRRRSGGRPLRG